MAEGGSTWGTRRRDGEWVGSRRSAGVGGLRSGSAAAPAAGCQCQHHQHQGSEGSCCRPPAVPSCIPAADRLCEACRCQKAHGPKEPRPRLRGMRNGIVRRQAGGRCRDNGNRQVRRAAEVGGGGWNCAGCRRGRSRASESHVLIEPTQCHGAQRVSRYSSRRNGGGDRGTQRRRDCEVFTRAGKCEGLRAALGSVGDGYGCGSGPAGGRIEGYTERATGVDRDARAAVVGLGGFLAGGNAGDAEGRTACVGEGHALNTARSADKLGGESQGSRRKLYLGRSGAGSLQADSLGSGGGVVGYGQSAGCGPGDDGLKGYRDATRGAGCHTGAAGVGLREGTAGLDAADAEQCVPRIRQQYGLGTATRRYLLWRKG